MTVDFLALPSGENLVYRSGIFGEYYLSINKDNLTFKASKVYKDHNLTIDSIVGEIVGYSVDKEGLKISVDFKDEVNASREAYEKIKNNLVDCVSVGLSNLDFSPLQEVEGLPCYKITGGVIHEVSLVYEGAIPGAKKIPSVEKFNLDQKELLKLSKLCPKTINLTQNKKETKMNFKDFLKGHREFLDIGKKGYKASELLQGDEAPQSKEVKYKSDETKTIVKNTVLTDDFLYTLLQEPNILNEVTHYYGLRGNLSIPKETKSLAAEFIEEGASLPAQPLGFSQIDLTPHTLSARVEITRTMLHMSELNLKDFVNTRLKDSIKRKLEMSILNGASPCPIIGLCHEDNITKSNAAITKLSYANLIKAITSLRSDNISEGGIFVGNAKMQEILLTTLKDTNTNGIYLMNERNTILGARFILNNHTPDNILIYGHFKNIALATFGDLEINTYEKNNGNIELVGFYDVDSKILRKEAFNIIKIGS